MVKSCSCADSATGASFTQQRAQLLGGRDACNQIVLKDKNCSAQAQLQTYLLKFTNRKSGGFFGSPQG